MGENSRAGLSTTYLTLYSVLKESNICLTVNWSKTLRNNRERSNGQSVRNKLSFQTALLLLFIAFIQTFSWVRPIVAPEKKLQETRRFYSIFQGTARNPPKEISPLALGCSGLRAEKP
jgi:hypothetical protein